MGIIKQCRVCSKEFDDQSRMRRRLFCSRDCKLAERRARAKARTPIACMQCGELCTPTTAAGRHCSVKCAAMTRGASRAALPADSRFWPMVDQSGGPDACWPWTSWLDEKGYGKLYYQGRRTRTHRVAWMLVHGPIPSGMHVLHCCEGRYPPSDFGCRRCCNPAHLRLGTHQENMTDRNAAGRQARGDRSGARTKPERWRRGESHPWRLHPEKVPRGERSGMSKLTNQQAAEIRRRYAMGGISMRALGREFGVTHRSIGPIVRNEAYRE